MIGKQLAHYEITGLLGKGGMGEVYRARDTKLERDVALKILPAELATDSSRLERFHREAKTVAGLNHPSIVHMYSVESDAGVSFLTMELVEGQELASLLPTDGWELRKVLEIGSAIADALAEAHEKGVVHRDLKPANVMLTESGRVKVLDFGLAKLVRESSTANLDATHAMELTGQGAVLGTIPYMSPEQLRGQETDHRSDLFSLGILLHELATGRRPFEGSSPADVSSSILQNEPSDILAIKPELPLELKQIIERCLEKDRDQRFASAEMVRDGLRTLQSQVDAGVHVSSQSQISTFASGAGGFRRSSLIAAVLFFALAAAALLRWAPWNSGPTAPGDGPRPIVAVLPFENLGAEEEDYFAAGITDEITSRLGLIDGLGVISRTSARLYEATEKSIPEVGRELGSDFVLEGTILWDKSQGAGRVRISPRLIRVADDTNVWSERYAREVTEIFSLQADIASRIADALDITLVAPTRQALESQPTDSIEAYQAYLQGMRHLLAPGFSHESFELGVQMFSRAIEIDPQFALAHARLSSMHSRMFHYGFDRSEERLRLAKQSADHALRLQSELPEAHLAMAHYFYWCTREYEEALGELVAAAELAPGDGDVLLTTAYVKRRQGEFESAIELLERNQTLSPRDANVPVALGETYSTLRRYAEAEKNYRHGIALAPEDPYPYTELALLHLRWHGDPAMAREILLEMPGVDNSESYRVRILVAIHGRHYDQAMRLLDESPHEAFETGSFYIPLQSMAGMILRLQNEPEAARVAFEAALAILEQRLAEDPLDHRTHGALGLAHAGLGHAEGAIRHGRRGVELYPLESDALGAPLQVINLAMIYTMLGEVDRAVEQLRAALSIPSILSTAWLRSDPRWDSLRVGPGFQQLLEEFGAGA